MALVPRFRPDMVTLITTFIRDTFADTARSTAIVGMSGGVDSALVAKLCVEALGAKHVRGIALPEQESPLEDLEDARSWGGDLGIALDVVDIAPMVAPFRSRLGVKERKALGNIKARTRMIVLYDLASGNNGLVVGTSNKSEIALGYMTKFGDAAADLDPIGDLYKTQVRALARHLGIPEVILAKPPTADLVAGQTDEEDFGISYPKADAILHWLLNGYGPEQIAALGFSGEEVELVRGRLNATHWKRKLPTVAVLSGTAIGEFYLRPVDY